MCSGWSRSPAFSSRAATRSSPASPRRNASSAKLSRTVAAILALLQFFLLALVLGPFLGKGLLTRLALEDTTEPVDRVAGYRFEQNPLLGGGDDGAGAVLDMEELAQSKGDDYLPF